MQRIKLTPENQTEAIAQAVATLQAGGLILYPTETMYGVGVDATNSEAVTRLLAYKNRPAGKSISVLVANQDTAESQVVLNETAKNLYSTFLPGPVTVISESCHVVDRRLESEFGTLGIRISSHPLTQALAEAFGNPITSTSANASGKARPYSIEAALNGLSVHQKSLIDLIIDAGDLPPREPSTVIDTTQAVQEVVRRGAYGDKLVATYTTHNEEETREIGRKVMKGLTHVVSEKALVFLVEGPMAAGKTQLAKGVAESLGITDPVTSPTYTLLKEYEGQAREEKMQFTHMDCWRLSEYDPELLPLKPYLQPGNVLYIEWPLPVLPYLEACKDTFLAYYITIEPKSLDERELTLKLL